MGWLKDVRTEKGMSGEAVAKIAKISRSAYCNIENGKRRPSVYAAKRIADALDFEWTLFFDPPDELYGRDPPTQDANRPGA